MAIDMGYRIKTVSELTGIPKNTLVSWERRYKLLSPQRLANGYRVYSDRDIALLQRVKSALEDGLSISEAAAQVVSPAPPSGTAQLPEDGFGAVQDQLYDALVAFDRDGGDRAASQLLGLPHRIAIERVYFPLMQRIGDDWEADKLSVAQEHFASSFVRDRLSAMLLGVGSGPAHGTHVVCTTFPNEKHEIPILGLAVVLALAGCRVTYLGADLPLAELAQFARREVPAMLCISIILRTEEEQVMRYARELRAHIEASTQVVLGGAGAPFERAEELAELGVSVQRDWRDLSLLG